MTDLNLCITSTCNCNCSFCCAGPFRDGPEQKMSVEDVARIASFASLSQLRGPRVTLSGGEPTLHPQLVEIAGVVRRASPTANIRLLTNLTCGQDVLSRLDPLNIGCVVNVGGYPGYSTDLQKTVRANLAFLRESRTFRWLWLAVTIVEADQDVEFLYEMLRGDRPQSIEALRLAISVPGQSFANRFPPESSFRLGEKYLEVVEQCHRIRPLFTYVNECFMDMCMMSEDVYAKLDPVVRNLRQYCAGAFDILPDFSMPWCFAFAGVPEMSIANLFDYRNLAEARAALQAKAGEMLRQLDRQCDTRRCTSVSCPGPCPATLYYRKYIKGDLPGQGGRE
ncbi:MAG: radical SAM protein [Planctomycetes bacterium]|nr:radical SAM protein [Planctomycetota bacterium]